MHAIVGQLASRAVEATVYQSNEEHQYNIPPWGMVMLALTALIYLVLSITIDYTFGRLIPTLLIVESPQAVLYEPLDIIDPDAPITKNIDSDLLIKAQPITSSFRRTVKHLQAKAGLRARLRGFALFAVYCSIFSFVSNLVFAIPFVPRGIAQSFSTVLLANLSLAWTHLVISNPSREPWYRRLPEARVWKKVAGPTAILAIAEQLSVGIPALLLRIYGFQHVDPQNMSSAQKHMTALKGISILISAIVLSFIIVLPANVILTRVQASLLPDNQETIVPCDRSFGGKVTPAIVGGSGVLGLLDAWKTFDWNARVRLAMAYAKVFAMEVALAMLFVAIAVGELSIIIGQSQLKKIITGPKNGD